MTDPALPPVEDRFSVNVIQNLDNALLLLKRAPQSRFGPARWGFIAGHIKTHETPRACALRELREEIGSAFTVEAVGEFGPVRDHCYGGIYEIHLFHLLWLGGEIRLNPEHTDYAWVSCEDYKNYPVMDGVDEDIRYLGVWPTAYLNQDRLP